MAEKNIKSRIVHKHDTEANWKLATGFTPMAGEIIVYDIDSTHTYERIKIGDGKKNVNSLPFVDDAVNSKIVSLVGNTSVAAQIAAAQMVYVGPTEPTDPNIKVWINTAEESTGIVPVLPRVATITLTANGWSGNSSPYSQNVNIATVTAATKVELNPTVSQIVSLQNNDIALMADNDNGTVTVYAFGDKPSSTMTMQATLTEVSYV